MGNDKLAYDDYLKKYQDINWNEDISISREVYLLSEANEYLQWQNYTNEERHEKRKFVFNVINKTGNSEEFVIETTVIELYDLVESILSGLILLDDNQLKTRLHAMLNVLTLHINKQRDTRKMSTSAFDLILNIARQCIKNNAFTSLHETLEQLIILLEKLFELKKAKDNSAF